MNTDEKMMGSELNPGGLETSKKHTRRRRILIILGVLLAAIIVEFFRSNLHIEVEEIEYMNKDIPKGFNGAKILQISDYHNHGGGLDNNIVKIIEEQSPDYIFITGDTVDSIRTDTDKAEAFLEKISKLAECYIVWGNHDKALEKNDRKKIKKCCEKNGITLLDNKYVTLERNGSTALLAGSDVDPDVGKGAELIRTMPSDQKFVMWLHHYPEDFEKILKETEGRNSKADLIFTGHAHGGLIRLPFIKGIYAPGQGMFPEYTSGRYNDGDSTMIVSRGVGNSGWTLRWGNSFHIIVCTLKSPDA